MIIIRTPYRISFFGGGTDYPTWYEKYGGTVLSTTISQYCYISLRYTPPFLGTKYRVHWSRAEEVDKLEDIKHPGVRGCLQYLEIDEGVEVNHAGDLPARSGLGSSSAFTVGMLHALHTLRGEMISRGDLANEAIEVEQVVLGETVGIQDQIQCTWGGLNHIKIEKDGDYILERLELPISVRENLEDNLVLVFTGLQRHASQIAAAQVSNFDHKKDQLDRIAGLVGEGIETISHSPKQFGELLHETWMLKRDLAYEVTNVRIDEIYQAALNNGAYGGKVLGAGGGGFILFCVPPQHRQRMIECLGLMSIPVKFEYHGTQIVLS
ncbi:hypothetical protein LCGC14_1600040 [marine sediment metagenome]|uniref:GHMP kinase N-terminal domain-containing protein n=1 Tax=marine sediment metagenome TaxID=412755 RepID=A0A0F9LBH7_9ZZZZ